MRFLENAFRFTFKNFLITIPLLIAKAIPAAIMGVGLIGFLLNMGNFQRIIEEITRNPEQFNFNLDFFFDLYGQTMIISTVIATILSLIFSILVYPATYGLINKKYETGSANLSDITRCMSKFIGRYVVYLLLNLAIDIGVTIIFCVLVGIATVILIQVSSVVGILLLVLSLLALIVGIITLAIYMSLWFPAICTEDIGVIQGLKNSFKYVSGSFWPILGITLLVLLCGGVASMILSSIVGWIPVVGSVVGSVVTTIAGFITIVFYFEIYREKTGRFTIPENFEQLNGGVH